MAIQLEDDQLREFPVTLENLKQAFVVIIFLLRPLQYVNKRLLAIVISKVPLMNWINITVFVFLLIRFIPRYSRLYANNKLTTTLISNLLLFGLADSLAQTLGRLFLRQSPVQLPVVESLVSPQEESFQIFVDYGEEDDDDNTSSFAAPAAGHVVPFDFGRLLGFMLWGFIMSFFQLTWYIILNDLYVDDPKFITVLERVLADQLCYSPVSLAAFFYYSSIILEGGDKSTFKRKFNKIYLSTLAVNYCVWPAVQFINFLAMPKQYQVPFSSSVGVLWNCFLSIRNAQSAA